MHRFLRHIFIILVFLVTVNCPAQNDDFTQDSIVEIIEPAQTVEGGSKFSTIKESVAVEVRKVPEQKLNEIKNDDAYWYANQLPPKKKKAENQQSSADKSLLQASWFRNLLWIIILCSFIGVVIWYLASSNIRLFQKKSKKIVEQEIEEELPDDIFSINYEQEIQKATTVKNYRLAIRLWYLNTLKDLSDRNIIDYRHGKTDNDYVNSLYGGRFYNDFFRLTRNFEYTWYGQFAISSEAYEMMRADFTKFKNSLS
jgi:hypothetical protein